MTVAVLLLGLPALLFLVTRQAGVRYHWEADALHVQAGVRRYTFPYATTAAQLTTQPLGARLFGSAASGSVTGRYALGRQTVLALATTARPAQALLLQREGQTYYLTPDEAPGFLDRFQRDTV